MAEITGVQPVCIHDWYDRPLGGPAMYQNELCYFEVIGNHASELSVAHRRFCLRARSPIEQEAENRKQRYFEEKAG